MPRRPPSNMALKMAIIASGLHQQDVALAARIEPQRLSHVIYGRRCLMPNEQRRVAKVLHRPVAEVFPPEPPQPTIAELRRGLQEHTR